MNTQLAVTYGFYLGLLTLTGVGEFFHLLPMGTAAAILAGVLGHGISEISHATGANNNNAGVKQ